jgi:hypothetical protein
LKPWQKKMWCIPPRHSAEFVCAMENVLEVYQQPYDEKIPLVCLDELPVQLVGETRTPLPAKPGQVECVDYEYRRNGTANLFMVVEPLKGCRRVKVTQQRTRRDWALLIKELVDVLYPKAARIRAVMDNLNTHTAASLYEAFEPAEARRILKRLEIIHTPKHGSWLNVAEIELSALSRQCLDRRIGDVAVLEKEVAAWERKRNASKVPIDWRFTEKDARIKLKRLYPKLQD